MALPSNIADPNQISALITGLIRSRDTIRTTIGPKPNGKWDITEAAGASLATLASIIDGITVNDNIDVDLMEGDTYNIPKGYHTGAGVVKGVAGGGNYTLQAKTVSAGRSDITVVPDQGKYGLSSVKVNAIPSNLQDVSYVTATAGDVLAGKNIVISNGTVIAGTMVNNGAVTQTLSTAATAYTIPQGYHSGSGKVSIKLEEKTTTPSTSTQVIVPTTGSVLSKVTVNAIPSPYYDVSGVTAAASQVLAGTSYVTANGTLTAGTMTNRGAVSQTLSTTSTQYTVPQGYHNGSGTVKIVLEDKSVTPAAAAQTVYPTAGKVFNKITVNKIPAPYYNTSGVTAVASHVLTGEKFVNSSGTTVTGTMADNSAVGVTLNILNTSYTIPTGFHNGNGLVGIVTETQTVTPSASAQTITATNGKVLASVTVNAIPSPYYNVSGVTAAASQVLAGTSYVTSSGALTSGTMVNRGAVSQTLSTTSTQYTVPQGYHSGSGTVKIVTEDKTLTPAAAAQTVYATAGKVINKVTVNAIPAPYYNTSGVTAVASHVLTGEKFVNSSGTTVTGTMPANSSASVYMTAGSNAQIEYTIPSGYHNGTGKVIVYSEGKTVTPTTSTQYIKGNQTPLGPGYDYFLSGVTVNAIPAPYYDVSGVTATASQVLTGTSYVTSAGTLTAGTMTNRGAVSQTLSTTSTQYTVPQGYHNGAGTVKIVTETKSATPSTSAQTIVATSGKVLSSVSVAAIPTKYKDTTDADAVASQVLTGKKFVNSTGTVTGTMANNGAVSQTLSTTSTQYTVPQGYHSGSGTVKIVTEDRAFTPAATAQTAYATAGKVINKVTVNAIPAPYYDVSGVTAVASHVVTGEQYVDSSGTTITGTMAVDSGNGTITLHTNKTSHTIASGYHVNERVVTAAYETKAVTPTESTQTIRGTYRNPGYGFLSTVTVNPIPSKYKDTTGADAVAANVLSGKKFVNTTGTVTGNMANIGSQVSAIDGLTVASKLISQGYHDGTGYIYLTNDIEIALASI